MPLPGVRKCPLGATVLVAVALTTWLALFGPVAGRASAASSGMARRADGNTVSGLAVGAPPGDDPLVSTLPARSPSVRSTTVAGTVLPFGAAANEGSLAGTSLNAPVVAMAPTPDGHGYWLVASDGGVFSFGDAKFHGSTGGLNLNRPIVAMATTPDGGGYWLAAADGGIFSFGDAVFHGSLANVTLNQPVVAMAPTPDGHGYWLVASDGGVFSFGAAKFHGSTGGLHLNRPIVAMATTPDGGGYWLAAADGGIFSFGDAVFHGSLANVTLNQPVVAMAPTPDGHGYWLVASDGGVFAFGDARFYGSAAGQKLDQPIVDIVARPGGGGYWLAEGLKSASASDPFSLSLINALGDRFGTISAAVLDLNSGQEYLYTPGQEEITASIVKVEILGTLLAQAQVQNRSLSPTEQSLASAMITQSNNDAATSLFNEVNGAPAIAAFDASVGMTSTTPNVAWGLTTTTAADQVTLLHELVVEHRVLTAASAVYELGLMGSVEPDQAWGVSAGVGTGATVNLKNGWLTVGDTWTVNSIGWVNGVGRDYIIAVLTDHDPDEAYGIDSISMISEAAWSALTG